MQTTKLFLLIFAFDNLRRTRSVTIVASQSNEKQRKQEEQYSNHKSVPQKQHAALSPFISAAASPMKYLYVWH